MPRPNNRYRQQDYDWLVHLQGGEYCKKCSFRPPKAYGLHIDHVNDDRNDNRPANKQLLCDLCNESKRLEVLRASRSGAILTPPVAETECVGARAVEPKSSSDVALEADRKLTRESAEIKNEANRRICEFIIKSEWNRERPTLGLEYPRCIDEITRRIQEETGSGSQAATKRYLKAFTSDGSDWKIAARSRRIVPATFSEYDPDAEPLAEARAANHMRIAEIQRQRAEKAEAELKKLKGANQQLPEAQQ